MSALIAPHGAKNLRPLLLSGAKLAAARKKAEKMPQLRMTSRETCDLIMMGIGWLGRAGPPLVRRRLPSVNRETALSDVITFERSS